MAGCNCFRKKNLLLPILSQSPVSELTCRGSSHLKCQTRFAQTVTFFSLKIEPFASPGRTTKKGNAPQSCFFPNWVPLFAFNSLPEAISFKNGKAMSKAIYRQACQVSPERLANPEQESPAQGETLPKPRAVLGKAKGILTTACQIIPTFYLQRRIKCH